MKLLYSLILVFSTAIVKAEVAPTHVESMLDQMVKENVISAAEAEKAKIRMKALGPEQWKAVNEQAHKIAARSPASATPSNNRIEEVHGIDLDGAQFNTIQNEVRKVVPQYKD
jgi:uncharacterized protein YmfQ (DUF2313 family)